MTDAELRYSLAASLLKKICDVEKENFVISPFSLGIAFATLSAGLKDETKAELLRLLGALDENELHSMYCDVISKKDLPLKMGNKYLVDQKFEIQQGFKSLLKEKYEAEVDSVDFVSELNKIEADVNEWVAKKTNNIITELLPANTLDANVILVLLNAIHFKGSWCQEFDLERSPQNFKLRSGETVEREFMTKKSAFGYEETEKLRLVKIPYEEAGFYMLLGIPRDEKEHIDEVISGLQPTELIEAFKCRKYPREIILSMPKFKIEYTFNRLQGIMKELGVKKIFEMGDGDFGNLFLRAGKGPFVDPIIHKAAIEVDEKGTTAAGATAIVASNRSLPRPPMILKFDRPFCFFIMTADDLVCFAGLCAQP